MWGRRPKPPSTFFKGFLWGFYEDFVAVLWGVFRGFCGGFVEERVLEKL